MQGPGVLRYAWSLHSAHISHAVSSEGLPRIKVLIWLYFAPLLCGCRRSWGSLGSWTRIQWLNIVVDQG